MKTIKIKSLHIQNFKGCNDRTIEFGDKTRISGANATGKTTVFDAFTWLLFGKDSSGNAKFDIRPLDADGNMINNIEISVEAMILIGDEEYSLRKTQKQVWRKKRGTDTKEFQGNVNEFEINGYPKSEKEFKDFISGVIDEKEFSIITNPNAFNSLPWKEQRETLMKFVGEYTDVQIAEMYGDKFAGLIPELKLASTDDILKKYTKSKNELNKQMDEIPARIDEVSKQLVIADVGALEVEKAAKQVELKKVEDELSGGVGKFEEIDRKRQESMDLKLRQNEIQNKANKELVQKKSEARQVVDSCDQKCRDIRKKISDAEYERDMYVKSQKRSETEKEQYANEWRSWKTKTFPEFVPMDPFVTPEPIKESDLKCPTCGQELPEEVKTLRINEYKKKCEKAKSDYDARCEAHKSKYEKEKTEFDSKRTKMIKDITEKGQIAADNARKYQKLSEDKQKEIVSLNESLESAKSELEKAELDLNQIPDFADASDDAEYNEIQKKIEKLEAEITEMSHSTSGRTELEAKKVVIRDEIAEIELKIKVSDNSKVKERISELEEEQKVIGQKIASQEQMIDLTENFIRTKMQMISETINKKFKVVSFKLFDIQINGGLKETCECIVNGVPFSSLNSGHKIIAGLDIIRSLSELYEINCPVFVDNTESISSENIPNMDTQMIFLEVRSPLYIDENGNIHEVDETYNADVHNIVDDGSFKVEVK